MELFDFRKKLLNSGDESFLSEVIDFLVYQEKFDPKIESLVALFNYSDSNVSPINQDDYKYFINKVIYNDYCNNYGISFKELTPEEKKKEIKRVKDNILRSIESLDGLAFGSGNLYNSSTNAYEDSCFVLNVPGSNLFKVVTAVYQALKENNISCTIKVPYIKDASIGLNSSIRVTVLHENIVEAVSVLESLPKSITRLISEPSLMYAKVNSYIGYDFYKISSFEMQSRMFLSALRGGIHDAVTEMIDLDPKALIELNGENVAIFREDTPNKLYADLRILSRSISVDPALKDVAMKHIEKKIEGLNRCRYAFSDYDLEGIYNNIDPEHKVALNYFIDENELTVELPQVSEEIVEERQLELPQTSEETVEEEQVELPQVSREIVEESQEVIQQEYPINPPKIEFASQQIETSEVNRENQDLPDTDNIMDRPRRENEEEYLDNLLKSMMNPRDESSPKNDGVFEESLGQENDTLEESVIEPAATEDKGSEEAIEPIGTPFEANLEVTRAIPIVGDNVSLTSEAATFGSEQEITGSDSIDNDLQWMAFGEKSVPIANSFTPKDNLQQEQIEPYNGEIDLLKESQQLNNKHSYIVPLTQEELIDLYGVHSSIEGSQVTDGIVPDITGGSGTSNQLVGNQFNEQSPSAAPLDNSKLSSVEQAELENILEGELDKRFIDPHQEQKNDEILIESLTPDQITAMNATLNEVTQATSGIEHALSEMASSLSEEEKEEVPSLSDDNLTTSEISSLIKEAKSINVILTRELEEKYEKVLDSLEILNQIVPGTDVTFLTYFENNYLLTTINPNGDYRLSNDEIITGKEVINRCVIRDLLNEGNVPLRKLLGEHGVGVFGINNPHIPSKRKGKIFERFRKNI